jgi:hypothetical protein
MPRFQQLEGVREKWGDFRRLPIDFQIFAAIGVLAPATAVLLVLFLTHQIKP